ncbi:hypothetical protein OEZ85_008363 [Tetradesmus obliquus]|uniref:RAP domain-containing protein n=1 Tax=Tetradesmus obliquus TaxID=3088 RepID=A0ABY8TKW7_TETOB|nr:hypothetical protein OEZ85_008363 [Tetradesmus obliquus]
MNLSIAAQQGLKYVSQLPCGNRCPRRPAAVQRSRFRCCCASKADNSQDGPLPPCSLPSAPMSSAAAGSAISAKVLQTDGKQLAQLLLRLSELQVRPHQQWLTDALDTLQPQLSQLNGAELSGCLQALGTWQYAPAGAFMQAFHAATSQKLQQQALSMRHLGEITWGLAQLQDSDAAQLMGELLEAAAHIMAASQPASSPAGTAPDSSSNSSSNSAALSCAGMADLVWAVAKLQIHPGKTWMAAYEAASQQLLRSFSPHELAQVVWAFARLPYQPSEAWRGIFLEAVQARLPEFDSKSISLTAWGLATLKFTPDFRWLFNFERRAECVLSTLAAAELACTLWALSELKQKSPHKLRLGRLVRRQERFHAFDFQLLVNPRLLRVVRSLTLGPQGPPQQGRPSESS